MLKVGNTYQTVGGRSVRIEEEFGIDTPHRCVRGDDGKWRFNRPADMGRLTGANVPADHPDNLVIEG